ncbi:MAG: Wzz/FepE/Etk N-terminal domain-containing protein, partial [Janthinobacterium lividum]
MLNAWQTDAAAAGVAAPPSRVAADLGWREIIGIWLRAAWFIVPAAFAGGAACYAFSLTMSPVYQAQAVLMLDRPDSGRLDNPADSPAADSQQRATMVHSQIETIRGDTVVAAVIAKLHLADEPMFHPTPGLLSRWTNRPDVPSTMRSVSLAPPASTLVQSYLAHLT